MSTSFLSVLKNLNLFGALQKIGKALMLPVAVLPVAGLLLASARLTSASSPPRSRTS